MKIICIGNYPPRQCGIATFTENLIQSILNVSGVQKDLLEIEIIAMNDSDNVYQYPEIVKWSIQDQNKSDYIRASEYINKSGAEVCMLQHEYGIFGGESGLLLLALLRRIKIPIISTFHTVLQKPTFHQKEVLQKIAAYSSKVVVMNSLAIGFLKESFGIKPEKIVRIQHGVPDFGSYQYPFEKTIEEWKNRKIIMTFGLIGRSKGIDTVIRSLPQIIKDFPDVLYVVLGKTHPHIIKYAGEEYRDWLKKLAKELGVENHIMFIDQYVEENDLMNYLRQAYIYVTPYQNKAQITSGTLSYAVASGCAVVSTPYWHAIELLDEDRGILFDFNDSKTLSSIICELLSKPRKLEKYRQKAFSYGKSVTWSAIGASYISLLNQVTSEKKLKLYDVCKSLPKPELDLAHLKRLTDRSGVLQHAKSSIPYFSGGYCLDDNSRALVFSLLAYENQKSEDLLELIDIYASNILYMQREDGSFDNLLNYNKTIINDSFSEDALGRTFWALGSLVNRAPNDSLFQLGMDLFHRAEDHLSDIRYARGLANTIFGFDQMSKRFPDQEKYRLLINDFANKLVHLFNVNHSDGWNWFEETLSYDNALIPASLYVAYQINHDKTHFEVAESSRIFLESKCFKEHWLSLIGNERWPGKQDEFSLFAQQPIDAFAMAMMYDKVYHITNRTEFKEKLILSLYWFLGYNDLNISLFDSETKGCHDGIEEYNINTNQGAESLIAYLHTYLLATPFL